MIELVAWVVAAAIVAFVVALFLYIVAGLVHTSAILLGGIARVFGFVKERTGGRHAEGKPNKPVAEGDAHGWEAEEWDEGTGEVKSFVWRGNRPAPTEDVDPDLKPAKL